MIEDMERQSGLDFGEENGENGYQDGLNQPDRAFITV